MSPTRLRKACLDGCCQATSPRQALRTANGVHPCKKSSSVGGDAAKSSLIRLLTAGCSSSTNSGGGQAGGCGAPGSALFCLMGGGTSTPRCCILAGGLSQRWLWRDHVRVRVCVLSNVMCACASICAWLLTCRPLIASVVPCLLACSFAPSLVPRVLFSVNADGLTVLLSCLRACLLVLKAMATSCCA